MAVPKPGRSLYAPEGRMFIPKVIRLTWPLFWTASAVCLVPSRPLVAQMPADTVLTDAKVVELVGALAMNRYGFLAARAALDTTTHAMVLLIPSEGPVALWQRLKDHLFTIMRLRPHTEADNYTRQLFIQNVRVSGDTLSAEISTGVARNCRPGWYEDRSVHEVVWTRKFSNVWVVESDKPIMWSESFGRCPGDPE